MERERPKTSIPKNIRPLSRGKSAKRKKKINKTNINNNNAINLIKFRGTVKPITFLQNKMQFNIIYCLIYTKQDKICSCGDNENICVYNYNEYMKGYIFEGILKGHKNIVYTLSLMTYENEILSGSEDRTIRQWDLNTYTCLKTIEGHTDAVLKVISAPDGKIISGSNDNTVKIWDLINLKEQTLKDHKMGVNHILLIKQEYLLTGSLDKLVYVYNYKTLEKLFTISNTEDNGWLSCMFYNESDDKLYIGGEGKISLINTSTFQIEKTFKELYKGKTLKDVFRGLTIRCILKVLDGSFIIGLNSNTNQLLKLSKDFKFKTFIKYPYNKPISCSVCLENTNKFLTANEGANLIKLVY